MRSRWLAPRVYWLANRKSNLTHPKPAARISSLVFRDSTLIITVSTKWVRMPCVTHTTNQDLQHTHGLMEWVRPQTLHAVDKKQTSEEKRYRISIRDQTRHLHREPLLLRILRISKLIKAIIWSIHPTRKRDNLGLKEVLALWIHLNLTTRAPHISHNMATSSQKAQLAKVATTSI